MGRQITSKAKILQRIEDQPQREALVSVIEAEGYSIKNISVEFASVDSSDGLIFFGIKGRSSSKETSVSYRSTLDFNRLPFMDLKRFCSVITSSIVEEVAPAVKQSKHTVKILNWYFFKIRSPLAHELDSDGYKEFLWMIKDRTGDFDLSFRDAIKQASEEELNFLEKVRNNMRFGVA